MGNYIGKTFGSNIVLNKQPIKCGARLKYYIRCKCVRLVRLT